MPFGPYDSFTDCVGKNGDKSSPEAFCAWLEHQITGKWPSEMQKQIPEEAWPIYRDAYSEHITKSTKKVVEAEKEAHNHALKVLEDQGWTFSRIGWVKQYAAPKLRTVANVRIFAIGEWTDSSGNTKNWNEAEIDELVKAFNAGIPGIVPLKAGHTPDTFNQKIAEKLGVPVELVTGDHGKGQISIGRMATLERRGNLVMASFERVPDPIAGLIESGFFSTVSVEIEDNLGDFKSAITAVALLGAEEPAVDEATLDRALVFGGKRENAYVLTFGKDTEDLEQEFEEVQSKLSETIKGMRGAPVFRAMLSNLRTLFDQITRKREHQNNPPDNKDKEAQMLKLSLKEVVKKFQNPPTGPENDMMGALVAIATALGLGDGSTVDDILKAIEALKGVAPQQAELSTKFQKASDDLTKANDRIAILEHKNRVSGYLEQTRLFTAIPDKTASVIAVELAEIEESRGVEKAKEMLTTYTSLNKMGEAATKVLGTSRSGNKTVDFEGKIVEYQKANPAVTRGEAVKAVMKTHPELRLEYEAENKKKDEQ